MTDADKNPEQDHLEFEPGSGLQELVDRLDARGELLRTRAGLSERIQAASLEDLPAPQSFAMANSQTGRVWGRLALAACALLAFAVAARILLNPTARTVPDPGAVASIPQVIEVPQLDDLSLTTETDTVLVALLEAGRNGQIHQVETLEGVDPVGAAFAPILGTTGMGFDDYLAEISLIEVELRR
jgi:hypothetical protein